MKNLLLTGFLWLSSSLCFAQSDSGIIAHWNMNGSANDVSGNGHNGNLHSVIADTGFYGLPNTAYRFNGISSFISSGYTPDLNITRYSICAVIKVKGFYTGTCFANTIFARGAENGTPGHYNLYFTDVNNACSSARDSANETFAPGAGPNTIAAGLSSIHYTPTITKDRWYHVVVTYDSSYWKMYVDDTLKYNAIGQSLPIGTSTDSLTIGYNVYEAGSGYPYYFKGLIDDISLYNRVLSDSEIVHYGDTCGAITQEPTDIFSFVGATRNFITHSNIVGSSKQWQMDGGTGYTNLTNSGPFFGVTTDTLKVTGISATLFGNHFRCVFRNSWGCIDTTYAAILQANTKTEEVISSNDISVFPNPATNEVTIQLPDNALQSRILVTNLLGKEVQEYNLQTNSCTIYLHCLPVGLYILKIEVNGNVFYKQIVRK